jgi:serine/threonine protein kinase
MSTQIGKGSYGTVYTESNTPYVVKKSSRKHYDTIIRELATFSYLRLTCKSACVRLENVTMDKKHVYLRMHHYFTDLHNFKLSNTIDQNLRLHIIRNIACRQYELESCGIIHRDIKPANILISRDRKEFVFCDLGSAVVQEDANRMNTTLTTYAYLHPMYLTESFACSSYCIDHWSIVAIWMELMNLRLFSRILKIAHNDDEQEIKGVKKDLKELFDHTDAKVLRAMMSRQGICENEQKCFLSVYDKVLQFHHAPYEALDLNTNTNAPTRAVRQMECIMYERKTFALLRKEDNRRLLLLEFMQFLYKMKIAVKVYFHVLQLVESSGFCKKTFEYEGLTEKVHEYSFLIVLFVVMCLRSEISDKTMNVVMNAYANSFTDLPSKYVSEKIYDRIFSFVLSCRYNMLSPTHLEFCPYDYDEDRDACCKYIFWSLYLSLDEDFSTLNAYDRNVKVLKAMQTECPYTLKYYWQTEIV